MPSGKQVLLDILSTSSQMLQGSNSIRETSDQVKAGLLLHGSTAERTWCEVEKMDWLSSKDEDGSIRQGLGLSTQNLFLSDLLDAITESDEIPEAVRESYPDLSKRDYVAGVHMISLLLSAFEYYDGLSSVEDGGKLDTSEATRLVVGMIAKLQAFRQDPYGFVGRENPKRKSDLNELLADIEKSEQGGAPNSSPRL